MHPGAFPTKRFEVWSAEVPDGATSPPEPRSGQGRSLMVVPPQGTASKSNRSGSARTALFIAALAVVATGFIGLGQVSSGDQLWTAGTP